jgi:hypothetical protein
MKQFWIGFIAATISWAAVINYLIEIPEYTVIHRTICT